MWKFILSCILAAGVARAEDFGIAINHGRVMDPQTGLDAVRHIGIRQGDFLPSGDAARKPADDEELALIRQRVEKGLRRGAVGVGVGFGLAYTPAASHWEILEMFRLAARYNAAAFVHIRGPSPARPCVRRCNNSAALPRLESRLKGLETLP